MDVCLFSSFTYHHHVFWPKGQQYSPSNSTAVSRVHKNEHTCDKSHGTASMSLSLAAVCTHKFPFAIMLFWMCMCSPPTTARPTCVRVWTHMLPFSSTCDLCVIPASPHSAPTGPLLTVKKTKNENKKFTHSKELFFYRRILIPAFWFILNSDVLIQW